MASVPRPLARDASAPSPSPSPLRICVIADGRSPIARVWLNHFARAGHEIHLISTFPCDTNGLEAQSVQVVPVALARLAGGGSSKAANGAANGVGHAASSAPPPRRGALTRLRSALTARLLPTAYGWVAPFDVRRHVAATRRMIDRIAPDVVHAMRIQYEGILATEALEGSHYPLLVSIWGNDLEFWAARYPLIARRARRVLARATALHPDCVRDLELARAWGWSADKPAAVLPTNGGVDTTLFHPRAPDASGALRDDATRRRFDLPAGAPIVLNARGFRTYVRNDVFFHAIPRVLARHPGAVFVGVGMHGHPRAIEWSRALGITDAVRLLPPVSRAEMADLFRVADVAVSPSRFDGTPNTLLETMACGAFPVSGDIASVREWIDDGANGLLCDPTDVVACGDAIVRALDDEPLRRRAAASNHRIILARAEFGQVMRRAEALYRSAVAARGAV